LTGSHRRTVSSSPPLASSGGPAGGWIAVLGRDPEDDDALTEVVAFCPVCAAREFRMAAKTAETYT